MKQLFNRILGWRKANLPAGQVYNPLIETGFLLKELAEVNDKFIAGNTDKAVGEICDFIVYAVGALELINWLCELFEVNVERTVIENFDNKHCIRLLSNSVFALINIAARKDLNTFFLHKKYLVLIGCCFDCIQSLGYSPELALEETVKKIESREGYYDYSIGKFVKTVTKYEPDYSLAKI